MDLWKPHASTSLTFHILRYTSIGTIVGGTRLLAIVVGLLKTQVF